MVKKRELKEKLSRMKTKKESKIIIMTLVKFWGKGEKSVVEKCR
jgi:ribosomal protein S24E